MRIVTAALAASFVPAIAIAQQEKVDIHADLIAMPVIAGLPDAPLAALTLADLEPDGSVKLPVSMPRLPWDVAPELGYTLAAAD